MDVQPELMTEKKLGIIIVDKDSRNKKIFDIVCRIGLPRMLPDTSVATYQAEWLLEGIRRAKIFQRQRRRVIMFISADTDLSSIKRTVFQLQRDGSVKLEDTVLVSEDQSHRAFTGSLGIRFLLKPINGFRLPDFILKTLGEKRSSQGEGKVISLSTVRKHQ